MEAVEISFMWAMCGVNIMQRIWSVEIEGMGHLKKIRQNTVTKRSLYKSKAEQRRARVIPGWVGGSE